MRRLLALLDGLPDDARSTLPDPTDTPWGMVEELLAQLVELTSVYAAERRLKEPFTVPRPAHLTPAGRQSTTSRKPADGPDGGRTSVGLGAATSQMAAWAARNGGVGGNGAALLGYPPAPVTVGGEPGA